MWIAMLLLMAISSPVVPAAVIDFAFALIEKLLGKEKRCDKY